MKVSLNWLQEYVDINGLSAEEIADALTNSGLEVEAIEQTGAKFTKVIVAKCLKLEQHPNADKLRLATIDMGGGETEKVVCGAPNLEENMLIAFALDGAQVISRKDNSLFTLGKATIRGVESCGMVCSLGELGLEEQYGPDETGGIWDLKDHADESKIGTCLKEVLGLESATVLETAPLANRGDLMSMVGVAREVAALFDRELTLKTPAETKKSNVDGIKIALPDESLSTYYGGVAMKNISIKPSPAWMQERLTAAGVKVISNVVDITNYVLLETGQPLHAFDFEKLGNSGTVSVRRATAGETLKTLDEIDRTLTEEATVIAFEGNGKPDHTIALAGVMGGFDTEIDDNSNTLFLEGAYFNAATTRRSAKSVGLRTDASARFERGVDPAGVRKALNRAVELLVELAGAEVAGWTESPVVDYQPKEITLRLPRYARIIGMPIEKDVAQTTLEKLGFEVKDAGSDELTVTVPSYRQDDVTREVDLIEELVRITGYDNVPYTLPRKTVSVPASRRQKMLEVTHNVMQGLGLSEIMTTSLIGEALLEKTGIDVNREQLVTVTNSHSQDHTLMRQSLAPNMLEMAKFNQANGQDSVWVYELGRTYFKRGKANHKNSGVSEQLTLGGLITGVVDNGEWHDAYGKVEGFYAAKGILEAYFEKLGLSSQLTFKASDSQAYLHPGKTAELLLKGKSVGTIGELHPVFQKRLKFKKPVLLFEVNLESVFKAYKQTPDQEMSEISQYPAVTRDIAFAANTSLTHQDIVDAIASQNVELLTDVAVFDEYRGEQLGKDKRSLAYRLTFQSPERTLKDKEIDAAVTTIREHLAKALSVELR